MSVVSSDSPSRPLVALGLLADVLGIFSFVGLQSNRTLQSVAMIVLGLIAVAAATTQLIGAIRISVSLRGAYYQSGALRKRIAISVIALFVAAVLVIGAVVLALSPDDPNSPPQSSLHATKSFGLLSRP